MIKISCLQHGAMKLDYDLLVTGGSLLTKDDSKAERKLYTCPSFTYVIEHPEGNILFDASIHRNWEDEWLPDYQALAPYHVSDEDYFETKLKAFGLGPSDFKYLFLSHLHTDHAGNARLFAGTNTQVLVHEDELKGVANLETNKDFFLSTDYDVHGLKFTTLPGDSDIAENVRAISLPGHTWGTMGLMVHLKHCGTIILASDAAYTMDSFGPPATPSMLSLNNEEWARSLKKLELLQRTHNATIICGHDFRHKHNHNCGHYSPLADEKHLRIWPENTYN